MSRLSKNIIYNLVGGLMLAGLSLIAVRYIFQRLGSDALGIIYFVWPLSAVLRSALDMGISTTTTREVAMHWRDEPDYVAELVRTASTLYWAAFATLAFGLYAGAPWIARHWLRLETISAAEAVAVLRILGIGALLGLPRSLYGSLLRGLERMSITNGIDVFFTAAQQAGCIMVLVMGGGLMMLCWWLAASFAAWTAAYIVISGWALSWRAVRPGMSTATIRRNRAFAAHMSGISMLSVVHMESDKIIVSKLMPLGMVGFYGFAARITGRCMAVVAAISQAAYPALSAAMHREGRAGAIRQYKRLHDLVCFGTVPIFAAMVFASGPLFTFLFNRQVAGQLMIPVALLCVGYYMNGTLNMPYFFSLVSGRPDIAMRLNLWALIGTLPIAVWLVYSFGLTGAGLSWVVYHIFAYAYGVPRLCRECLETPVLAWYLHIAKVGALTGATYGAAWWLALLMGASAAELAMYYAAASVAFALGAWLMAGRRLRAAVVDVLWEPLAA